MNRREFVGAAMGVAGLGMTSLLQGDPSPSTLPEPLPSKLPRWRGFNLLEMFDAHHSRPFRETDFEILAGWGFNFVRLPMSYVCWTDPADWLNIRDEPLRQIDHAIELARQHAVHVNLDLHRAPGYCVNPPSEPMDLWTNPEALDACAYHWGHLARRYKGIPSARLSFDLLNEPPDVAEDRYVNVVTRLVEAIRAEDPERLVIADGLRYGNVPVFALADLRIGQSTRGYTPGHVSHYQASWVKGADAWEKPTWPLTYTYKDKDGHEHVDHWDKDRLRRDQIEPWRKLQARGVGVHVGEWGAHNRTPHDVVLAWMKDYLDLWEEAGWGWALWNLRGSFGVLDSGRNDVTYEDFRGHKLDRAMLEVLNRA